MDQNTWSEWESEVRLYASDAVGYIRGLYEKAKFPDCEVRLSEVRKTAHQIIDKELHYDIEIDFQISGVKGKNITETVKLGLFPNRIDEYLTWNVIYWFSMKLNVPSPSRLHHQ